MTCENAAPTVLSDVMFDNMQEPVPEQSPDQPSKLKCASAGAVNVRSEPSVTVKVQGESASVQVVVPSVTDPNPVTVTVTV